MTLRVAIIDDEPPARRKIRRLLERVPETEVVGEAGSGAEAIQLLNSTPADLVFLDIQMPDMDGFAVLGQIERPPSMQVVFVTAFDQHALRAFEVQALDYLLKPVAPERFEHVVERVRGRAGSDSERIELLLRQLEPRPAYPARIPLDTGGTTVFVAAAKIELVESAGNYLLVHAGARMFQIRGTLDTFASRLDPKKFPRINRSQLVNLDCVAELRPWFHGDYRAILSGGRELNWSRRYSPRSHLARCESR